MRDPFEISKMRIPGEGIVRMRTRVTPKAEPDIWGLGTVEARLRGKTIGRLTTHQRLYEDQPKYKGFITGVSVGGPYRRKGIARRMLQTSERVGHKPMHSGVYTEDGDKWVKAVGGRSLLDGDKKKILKGLPSALRPLTGRTPRGAITALAKKPGASSLEQSRRKTYVVERLRRQTEGTRAGKTLAEYGNEVGRKVNVNALIQPQPGMSRQAVLRRQTLGGIDEGKRAKAGANAQLDRLATRAGDARGKPTKEQQEAWRDINRFWSGPRIVRKGLPSYLRSTPKGMLSPGLQRRVRINEMGRTAARGAARAKQNPPTQGPFELPRQLTLIERNGTTTYNARRRKP